MSDDATMSSGQRFGDYTIVRPLARGTFGVVYEARRAPPGRRVALKVLHASMRERPEALTRFEVEAELGATLEHADVAGVRACGVVDGAPYLEMDYLDGETLEARITARGAMAVEEAVDLLLPLISAVAAVHAAGIVHRDLKPSNVLLARAPEGDRAKLLDLGIAKHPRRPEAPSLTLLGTPSYMSPEQVRESHAVDAQSDVWSLGVIAYECVTGSLPFAAPSVQETIAQVLCDDIAPPSALDPSIPLGFDAVILAALRRDPTARTRSARALGSALIPFASPTARALWSRVFPPTAPPVVDEDPQPLALIRPRRPRRRLAWLLDMAAAVVAAMAATRSV